MRTVGLVYDMRHTCSFWMVFQIKTFICLGNNLNINHNRMQQFVTELNKHFQIKSISAELKAETAHSPCWLEWQMVIGCMLFFSYQCSMLGIQGPAFQTP